MRRLLLSALEFSHNLLKETVREGDVVIDATAGNGNDTVLLATLVGRYGKVIGFDIQKQAIENTKQKLLLTGLSQQVTLYHQGHETIPEVLENEEQIGGIIFNLAYLPGSDKSITKKETTLQAVATLLPRLRIGSYLLLVVYSGHPGNTEENDALLEYATTVDPSLFKVLHYGFINQVNNPPFLIAIERKNKA